MSKEVKMNNEELEQVAGGTLTDEDREKIRELSEKMLEERGSVCRECGKKYLQPDSVLPEVYGDFSLCPECNRKKGLGWEGRKQMMDKTFGEK